MGPVGAAVVVYEEFVAGRVAGRVVFGGPASDRVWGVGLLMLVVGGFVGVLETADEEFAGEGDVDVHVAVHGVFR